MTPEGAGRQAVREDTLRSFGADAASCALLLNYNAPRFEVTDAVLRQQLPLPDEPFVEAWGRYLGGAESASAFEVLRTTFPQFAFPVLEGVSKTDSYKAATLKGRWQPPALNNGLQLHSPHKLRMSIHPSLAGQVPMIVPGSREDFVTLVQALSARNEPQPVPDSMGACTVSGFNNWERVASYRQHWESEHPADNWSAHFRDYFSKRPELYRDRFLIISQGPYSDVSASTLGLEDADWLERSFTLRLVHECTHYLTLRLLGSMANNLFDEIICDFAGICAANDGVYNRDWFLHFMGLENFPDYRRGARLENYCRDAELDEAGFAVLQRLIAGAADTLEKLQQGEGCIRPDAADYILTFASATLEELAAPDAVSDLSRRLGEIRGRLAAA